MIDEVDYDGDDEMTNDDKVEHLETISSACARTAAPICTDFLHRDVWEKGCKHNYDDLQQWYYNQETSLWSYDVSQNLCIPDDIDKEV